MNKINQENPFTQDDVDNSNDIGIKVERHNDGKIEIVEIKKPNNLLRIRNEFNKYRNEFNKNTEPQTKRLENVKPQQKSLLKEMMAQDEKDGLYESITEPYEPKVGDRYRYKNGIF